MGTEEDIKHCSAKHTSALVLEIIQGKTRVAEASRAYDLPPYTKLVRGDGLRQERSGTALRERAVLTTSNLDLAPFGMAGRLAGLFLEVEPWQSAISLIRIHSGCYPGRIARTGLADNISIGC